MILKNLIIVVFIILGGNVIATKEAVAAPPVNFQLETIIASGIDGPSGFEIAPDGRIFILQRTGEIKIVKNGVLLEEPFAILPSAASGDRGLIGIAFDPEFNITNHYVYFYYTGLDKINRLVRFNASSDIGQEGPFLLYQTNSPSEELHVGGSIRFGPDGKLYFAVGDNGYPPNAQNLSNPHGKILRINKDGSIPLDNPFYGQSGVLPEIWAYGFRNPWRFQFDSVTGKLYGGDVGDYTWEEVNYIRKGMNYGWPNHEGFCNALCGSSTTPIYAYNHNGESAAVTGGPVYYGDMFPLEYHGNLFFGDYAKAFIKRMTLDENGNATGIYDFDSNAGSVVDMKIAADGSMYYITYWPGRLYRISYTTGNHRPSANATADHEKGLDPHTVNFSSAGSVDPDGDPLSYLWQFGDGTTSTEANPTKTYTIKGTYTVELAVSDGRYTANAVPVVIQVGVPPTVNISEPADGSTYNAGDTIHYTVFGLDGAGFDIDDRNLSTEIYLHHDTHLHPFAGPIIGRQGTFHIPTTGEASPNTWFEIKTTALDTNGLSTSKSVFIYPIKSTYTINTQPAGLTVLLDGVPRTTPVTLEGVVNFEREFNVPTIQEHNGILYQFDHWSDSKPQKHFVATQNTPTTYTAFFREVPAFNAEYFDNTTLSGTPVLTRQDQTINFAWGDGSPDPQLNSDSFSVRWSKRQYFAAGKYRFITATDDGVRLYIDNQLLIDKFQTGIMTESVDIILPAGEHEIRMEYFEGGGGAGAKLTWDITSDQPLPANDFTAEYFDNKSLSGTPSLTRGDNAIDFDWGAGSPADNIPVDNYSVRWTKTESLAAGTYKFTVTADDGIRIIVDGQTILDKFIDQPPTTYTVQKTLTAGAHTLVVEYYEAGGVAVAKVHYEKINDTPTPPASTYSAEFFNNRTLTGTPILTRNDTAINFDWGGGAPDNAVPNDNFSARWTKTESFTAGTYEFSVTGDDGVRLIIDGEVVVDKFIDQPPTTYKINKVLSEGQHEIILEYYEATGGAVAKLSYQPTDSSPVPGAYQAEFFNNMTLSGSPVVVKTMDSIHYDWAGGSPDALINANNFSARWTRNEDFVNSGNYEFTVTADDGVRLIIDNEVIINKFVDQAPTTYKVIKTLPAGNHTIILEYYENGGGAVMQFGYEQVQTPVTTCPQNWSCQDIGPTRLVGETSFVGSTFTLKGSGWDIWNNDDMFHFASQSISGDATIIARVTSQTNTNPWAKAGVMIKESLTEKAKYVSMLVTPNNGYRMQYNFSGEADGGQYTFPNAWIKLTRSGDVFTTYKSIDGITWEFVGTTTLIMNPDVRIGLFVTAHDNNILSSATFEDVSITPGIH